MYQEEQSEENNMVIAKDVTIKGCNIEYDWVSLPAATELRTFKQEYENTFAEPSLNFTTAGILTDTINNYSIAPSRNSYNLWNTKGDILISIDMASGTVTAPSLEAASEAGKVFVNSVKQYMGSMYNYAPTYNMETTAATEETDAEPASTMPRVNSYNIWSDPVASTGTLSPSITGIGISIGSGILSSGTIGRANLDAVEVEEVITTESDVDVMDVLESFKK
jgi:hypothetical protein